MPTEVILPKVDMDMATGKISKWHVQNGDQVMEGAPLFEIETDKATMEIEAPTRGIIANMAHPGRRIAVGTRIAHIFKIDEAITPAPPILYAEDVKSQALRNIAPNNNTHNNTSVNISNNAGNLQLDLDEGGGLRATPLAKKMAREKNIPLVALKGTGPRGRIQAKDVVNANTIIPANAKPIMIDAMRRTIAERLTHAKQTIPHFYLTIACDVTDLLALRENLNKATAQANAKISVNDFIIKALALALHQTPEANVSWHGQYMLQYHTADIAVAVGIEGGILTPVVREAEKKSLKTIAAQTKDFAERARHRKLAPAEYHGGSSSISNLGMMGVEEFTAIINPPHATILAIGAVNEQMIVRQGVGVIRSVMKCTLSCDHRVIDGVIGAKLLQAVQHGLEQPQGLI